MHIRYYRPRRVLPVVVYVRLSVPGRMRRLYPRAYGARLVSRLRRSSSPTALAKRPHPSWDRQTDRHDDRQYMHRPIAAVAVCSISLCMPSTRCRPEARNEPSAIGASRLERRSRKHRGAASVLGQTDRQTRRPAIHV